MRVLVTGASGFLGSFVVQELLTRGWEVAVLTRPQSDFWRLGEEQQRLHIIRSDYSSLAGARAEILGFAPAVVIHAGWQGVDGAARNDRRQIDGNLNFTLDLVQLAIEARCQAWVGLGSQAEYGPHAEIISEATPTLPTTLYGAAKLSSYHLGRRLAANAGMRFAWLRLFSAYGPKDNPEWFIPSLLRNLYQGVKPPLTEGRQMWDYIYVQDASAAVAAVAGCANASDVFNLGSGNVVNIRELAMQLRDLVDPNLPLGFGEVPYRSDQVFRLQADITKLRTVTGWEPKMPLYEGLRQTAAWFEKPLAAQRPVMAGPNG